MLEGEVTGKGGEERSVRDVFLGPLSGGTRLAWKHAIGAAKSTLRTHTPDLIRHHHHINNERAALSKI